MHGDAAPEDSLAVRRRSPWPSRVAWVLGVALGAGVLGYVATHPDELPRTEGVAQASTPAGRPVFVGVFAAPADFGRRLEVSGVKVFATAPGPVTITPRLCRSGSVGVTSDPAPFCSEIVPTEGAMMGPGDEIILEVVGDTPGTVAIDAVRVAYRESFQWGTQRAGRPAVVTIL